MWGTAPGRSTIAEGVTAWRVGKAVGNVGNNDPSLIEAVA
jgi:hypothetical protein